jgi:uncharacterized protein
MVDAVPLTCDGARMPLFLYRIEPMRPEMPEAPTESEQALVGRHFDYLQAAFGAGTVKLVGRTLEAPHLGIAILEAAGKADAEAFLREDPAVAAGIFRGMVQAFAQIMPKVE